MVRLATMRLAAQRIPSIQFRKGGGNHAVGLTSSSPPNAASSGSSGPTRTSRTVTSGEVLEAYELPRRYQRAPISEDECAVINSGGVV